MMFSWHTYTATSVGVTLPAVYAIHSRLWYLYTKSGKELLIMR